MIKPRACVTVRPVEWLHMQSVQLPARANLRIAPLNRERSRTLDVSGSRPLRTFLLLGFRKLSSVNDRSRQAHARRPTLPAALAAFHWSPHCFMTL
jgi:hypothetical protein